MYFVHVSSEIPEEVTLYNDRCRCTLPSVNTPHLELYTTHRSEANF